MKKKLELAVTWTLWKPSPRTGMFPLQRILWNAIWLVPMYISRTAFTFCVFAQSGWERAVEAWNATS